MESSGVFFPNVWQFSERWKSNPHYHQVGWQKNAQRKRSDNYGFDKFIFYANCTPHKNQAAYLINEKNGPRKAARIFV